MAEYKVRKSEEVINELKKFQEELDGTILSVKSLQDWAGHMNFIITELIINVADSFKKLIEVGIIEESAPEPTEEEKRDLGGFYS